jgi:hypothetical protein
MSRVETNTYKITRTQLAYWTAFEYIRRFWPGFIAFPITGIVMFVTMDVQVVKGLGMLMTLWPLSIFARAILISGRAAKRVLNPTKMVFEGDHAYFIVEPHELNYRIHKDSVRDVKSRVEYVVIELWRYKLVFVPYFAFKSPEDVQEFRRLLGVV